MYQVGKPTRLRGISIPRSCPPVYIVHENGKRVDAFLSSAYAKQCARRLNDQLLDHYGVDTDVNLDCC